MTKNDKQGSNKFVVFVVGLLIALLLFTCESKRRVGAKCQDGSTSYSTGSGTCSHHGGVRSWKNEYWWD
jgi:hypothetical protein